VPTLDLRAGDFVGKFNRVGAKLGKIECAVKNADLDVVDNDRLRDKQSFFEPDGRSWIGLFKLVAQLK
jgi:hypothetical protein